jgi:hypothetical protein
MYCISCSIELRDIKITIKIHNLFKALFYFPSPRFLPTVIDVCCCYSVVAASSSSLKRNGVDGFHSFVKRWMSTCVLMKSGVGYLDGE